MRTRTIPVPEQIETPSTSTAIQREIKDQVDERGFYLYEWISPEELRTSVKADYLAVIRGANIPLAIITFLAGIIGLMGGILGVLIAIFGVLFVFYIGVFIALTIKMLHKSYLYTRSADVVITDDHYISGSKILKKSDFEGQKQAFRVMETIFREPLFGISELSAYVELQKKSIFEQFKMIASNGGSLLERSMRNSRDNTGIIMVIMIGSVLYTAMMGIVYFLGVGLVAILARIFSWISGRILLVTHHQEYTIQSLFHDINTASLGLKTTKKQAVSFLSEAGQNVWKDNLSKKIEDSFKEVNTMARTATEKSITLRKELEQSKYHGIFNFPKYDTWIKTQVLEPINEILELLEKNRNIVKDTIESLEQGAIKKPTDNMWGDTGQRALETQKTRLEMHIKNFDSMISLLQSYQEKLQ